MEQQFPCSRHDEQIKTLFKQDEVSDKKIEKLEDDFGKKIERLENDRVLMHNMDKNIALISKSIAEISEYNKITNIRMDEQHDINVKMSQNYAKLAEQYTTLDDKVDAIGSKTEKLAMKVDENDNKHKIDIRDLDKDKKIGLLKKYGEPAVIIGAIGTILMKLLEMYKG